MSVSYNYGRNDQPKLPHHDSASSYDQGYNTQPRNYSQSVTSDGFSDISFNPYNSQPNPNQYYGYNGNNNPVFSPDDGRRQVFDVQRYPINDTRSRARDSSAGSDVYNPRTPSIISSSVGRDADVESIASHATHTTVASYGIESVSSAYDQYRYNGELYRPVAAPRKVNSQVKKLFGEVHPRMLRPEEQPIVESGEETEDSSVSSFTPRAAPRASMRMNRSKHIEFIEDEDMRLENLRLSSILKPAFAQSKLDVNGRKMVVRFEYVDKYADCRPRRDTTDYSDIDSDHGGKSKKNKNKQKDIWSHVGPVGTKPAKNSRSGSVRSNSSSKRRSSSADRSSRGSQRSGSKSRSSSAPRSGSMSKRQSLKDHMENGRSNSTNTDGNAEPQVSIKVSLYRYSVVAAHNRHNIYPLLLSHFIQQKNNELNSGWLLGKKYCPIYYRKSCDHLPSFLPVWELLPLGPLSLA